MRKAAFAAVLIAGAVLIVAGVNRNSGSDNFVADVHAENAEDEAEKDEKSAYASKIDTNASVVPGSRIAVVSKSVKGEFWELVRKGMEDAVSDINEAYGFSSDEKISMTFEGPGDEQDVETQVNTLDAVISENPTVLCLSASDMDSCFAQLETATENGIPVIAFDSNVSDNELITAFRATDNEKVGSIAGEKMSEALTDGGEIAIFAAQEKTESSQKRVEAFKEALEERSDIQVVQEIYMDQVEDMEAAVSETLENYPDLAGVFCANAEAADIYLGIDQEDESTPVLIGVDATSTQQEAVRDGREYGVVSQSAYEMGYETILVAAYATVSPLPSGEDIEETILLEPAWIDASDIDDAENSKYLYGDK